MRLTKMPTRISALLAACALIFPFVNPPPSRPDSKPNIMTATTDLAALAQEVDEGEDEGAGSKQRADSSSHFCASHDISETFLKTGLERMGAVRSHHE